MNNRRHLFLIPVLGSLSALGPFSIDMYLPAFGEIAASLHTTVGQVGLSLSSYFIGISAGQLLYGPLLDRFGRKPPMVVGLALYILASFGCAYAQSIDALILLRFLQAVGCCAGAVAAVAMVRDFFPVSETAKVFALIMLVIGLSPMLAPTIGSYVAGAWGWRSIFFALAAISLAILAAVVFYLPESRGANPAYSLKPAPILRVFRQVISTPAFFTYALTGAVAAAGLFAYVSGSPGVFMGTFKLNQKEYGWVFAFNSIGLIGAAQVNSRLLRRSTSKDIIARALAIQLAAGLIFVILAWQGLLNLPLTIGLLWLFLCCQGFTFPNSSALALAPFALTAGSAAALMGCLQMAIDAAVTVIISKLEATTALPMAAVMCGCSATALTILLTGRQFIKDGEPALSAMDAASLAH